MGVQRKTRRFQIKRIIGQRDARLKKNQDKGEEVGKKKAKGDEVIREMYVHTPLCLATLPLTFAQVRKYHRLCSFRIILLSLRLTRSWSIPASSLAPFK